MSRMMSVCREAGAVLRDETGVSIAFVAMLLPVLLGATAFAVDVGIAAMQQARVQSAADAAALAGVQLLPGNPVGAAGTAGTYAVTNGLAGDTRSISVGDHWVDDDSVRVIITRTVPWSFGRIFGLTGGAVSGRARAVIGTLSSRNRLVPFGVECATPPCHSFGQQVQLKLINGSGGNWHPIRIDGSGASVYRNTIQFGSNNWLSIGQWITPEPGNMVGPTRQGVNARLDGNTQTFSQVVTGPNSEGRYTLLDPDSPRLIVVPYTTSFGNGAAEAVQVTGFGLFFLEGVSGQAGVTGRFINSLIPNSAIGPYQAGQLLGIKLIE